MAGSLAEVARRAGVSIATASRALSGSQHPVSEGVRERIERAAAEVGYSPSALARALVTRRSRILGVIVGDIVDPYFAEITRGVEDLARRHGYLTIVCNADRETSAELAYLRILRDYHAEGVIFAGGGFVDDEDAPALAEAVERATSEGIRIIALAKRAFVTSTVAVDNRATAYDITSYVLSLGHREIAWVEGPAGHTTSADRLAGFRAAMAGAGLEAAAVHPGNFDYESGQSAAQRMIDRSLPQAVIAANDESAIGVLMTLRQAGVKVPEEVSVAGIDDTRASRFVDLTTVAVPMYELGALAARRILDSEWERSGPPGTSPDGAAGAAILPHRVVPRSTTSRRILRTPRSL